MSIEGFRKAFGRYAEISTTVVMAAGVGLTAIFSGMISDSSANLNSFLFGSIVAVSDFELLFTIGLSVIVLAVSLLLYKALFFISFDEEAAFLAGVPVRWVNLIFMVLTAITVSAASRTVGALMISSLMVLPVACALLTAKSYRLALVQAIGFALFFTISGLFLAYYLDLKPGGTIVLCGVVSLVILLIFKRGRVG